MYIIFLVMKMKQTTIALIAVFLGILLPAFLMRPPKTTENIPRETQAVTVAPTEPQKEMTIPVLDGKKVVNMRLDDYLVSVVLSEMPASFSREALKAQAVVARTYALRRVEKGKKHKPAAVCVNAGCCQGYISEAEYLNHGGKAENIAKIRQAVASTKDLVLLYDGKLIDATYFSCSGGQTEDAVAVWGRDVPYLQSIDSPGEEIATHYTDTLQLTTEEFCERLGFTPKGDPIMWVESVTYTDGGGVDSIRICGREYKGTTLRKLLKLRSTAFAITILGKTVTVTTKGYGHRVGMSQYGAQAMALEGKDFRQILCHYYTGVTIGQWED